MEDKTAADRGGVVPYLIPYSTCRASNARQQQPMMGGRGHCRLVARLIALQNACIGAHRRRAWMAEYSVLMMNSPRMSFSDGTMDGKGNSHHPGTRHKLPWSFDDLGHANSVNTTRRWRWRQGRASTAIAEERGRKYHYSFLAIVRQGLPFRQERRQHERENALRSGSG